MSEQREPLPIWFFVGVILAVYGVLVILGDVTNLREIRLAHLRPGLWWGGGMLVFGAVFTALGLWSHRQG
ncbi:hypothetical protein KBD49_06550 [Myxococcota bacterium]|jgi:hypothetical protein|nr:hypothetical protein [Myxococcota bacterium]